MKKITIIFTLLVALCLTMTSCGEKITTLKVGMEACYAPFNWTEVEQTDSNVKLANVKNAYAEGYDVQIAKKLADNLGLELEIYALDWDALIPSLNSGVINMIIAGMSPTDKRKESIDFTEAYYTSEHVMLVKADSELVNAESLDDFADVRVVGQLGTLYETIATSVVKDNGAIAASSKATVPQILLDMNTKDDAGRYLSEAQVLELPVAKGICARDNSFAYVTFESGKGFNVSEEDKIVSIGIKKNSSLTEKINEALKSISAETRANIMDNAVNNQPQES